jgi:hypothetical protein
VIGLILGSKAITENEIYIDNKDLPITIYWLTESPTVDQIGLAASWGILSEVYGLRTSLSIKDAKTILAEMNNDIPKEWCVNGSTINKQLFGMLTMRDRLVSPFPEYVESSMTDNVRIKTAKVSGVKKINPNANISLSDLTLPEKLANTKIIASPRIGHEGIYQADLIKLPYEMENCKLDGTWFTCVQLMEINKAGFETKVNNAVKFISQDEFIRADKHPMLERIIKSIKTKPKNSKKNLERIIIDFLTNIPRTQGSHPVSILIKGQLWSNNIREVISLIEDGISVSSFSHKNIWVNIDE